jgi:hypothetical protein
MAIFKGCFGTLQKIVDDTIAPKQGEKLSTQLESMRVPEYRTCFPATCGADNGTRLASLYAESSQKTESQLVEYFVAHAPPGGQVTASVVVRRLGAARRLDFCKGSTTRFAVR